MVRHLVAAFGFYLWKYMNNVISVNLDIRYGGCPLFFWDIMVGHSNLPSHIKMYQLNPLGLPK